MTRLLHRIHGLTVASPYRLTPEPAAGAADVEIVLAPRRPVPKDAGCMPPGTTLANLVDEQRRVHYSFVRLARGDFLLRWQGSVDIEVNAAASRAVAHLDPAADEGLLEVICKGALPAFLLLARSHCVLHSSAVEHDGAAIAFVGASGMGKSTLATLACGAGARLLSDDVLRVDADESGVRAFRGVGETRLRPSASELATLFPPDRRQPTADGRQSVTLQISPHDELPLRLIVIPFPDRAAAELAAVRLNAADTMILLSRFPRFPGWQEPRSMAVQFQQLAEVAACVPVVQLRVPWGPPFAPLAAEALLDAAAAAV